MFVIVVENQDLIFGDTEGTDDVGSYKIPKLIKFQSLINFFPLRPRLYLPTTVPGTRLKCLASFVRLLNE